MTVVECKNCGATVDDAWSVCPSCGSVPSIDPAEASAYATAFEEAEGVTVQSAAAEGARAPHAPPPTTRVGSRRRARSCVACGAQLSADAKFCGECGTAVSAGARVDRGLSEYGPQPRRRRHTERAAGVAGSPFSTQARPDKRMSLGCWVVLVVLGLIILGVVALWVALLVSFARDGDWETFAGLLLLPLLALIVIGGLSRGIV